MKFFDDILGFSPVSPCSSAPFGGSGYDRLGRDKGPMDTRVLRTATAEHHRAAESAMPIMDDGLTLPIYVKTLQRLHGLVRGWDARCECMAPGWMLPMMRLRQRTTLLEEDLRVLSHEVTPIPYLEMPTIITEADFLGAMYVMEGSRLGGTLIAKHVDEALSLNGVGNSYFKGAGAKTGLLWSEFVWVLQTQVPQEHTDAVVTSAQGMFRIFAAWMLNTPSTRDNS